MRWGLTYWGGKYGGQWNEEKYWEGELAGWEGSIGWFGIHCNFSCTRVSKTMPIGEIIIIHII